MFHTASVTDLRFKTNELLKKSKNIVWIFKRGKPVALLIDAKTGKRYLNKKFFDIAFHVQENAKKRPSFLEEIEEKSFKGPKNLSTTIDAALYG